MLQIDTIPVTVFSQNCRILYSASSQDSIVVDPGGDVDRISSRLKELNKHCTEIWLTHSHLDHVGGVQGLIAHSLDCGVSKVKLWGHSVERSMREAVEKVAAAYGIGGFENCPEPDAYWDDLTEVDGLGTKWQVIHTPGHSPGHVCFYAQEQGILIGGDCLFNGSIGRTDLPGGDLAQLTHSIRHHLYALPDETVVLSGHGPDTTIGREKRGNPFVRVR